MSHWKRGESGVWDVGNNGPLGLFSLRERNGNDIQISDRHSQV